MILTYKYRLKGKRTERQLRRFAWAINQVWNFCVATQRETQRRRMQGTTTKWLSHFNLAALAKGSSKDLGLHAQSVQSTCDQFVKSRDQYKKCPRFRASGGPKRSLGWIPFQKQSRQIDGNAITYLSNTYRFFGAKRRPLPEIVKSGAFVEDAQGRWWVTLYVEIVEDNVHGTEAVGIDLGLKTFATLSNGDKIENLNAYRKWEEKLATAQRACNKRRVKAIHAKITNIRKDGQHKATTAIVRKYGLIAVGNVSSSNLAKTRMAKSVLDAGWSTFRNMLGYKASRHRAVFLEVNEKFTSQTCSSCGDCASAGRPKGIAGLGIREWVCDSCGVRHDRDVNAAKNILALGLSAQPRVDESRDSAERLVA